MSQRQNIAFVSGEDITITATLTGSGSIASETYGVYIAALYTPTVLIAKTSGAGVAILDATARTVGITLDDASTALLSEGVYRWEMWRTNDGLEAQLVYGDCVVRGSVRPAA